MITQRIDELLLENESMRRRLEETEETLRAIQVGEVDAVVVAPGSEKIYTLETVDRPYRLLVEQMPQGAATLSVGGLILYCNRHFADLLQRPLETLLGASIHNFVSTDTKALFKALLSEGLNGSTRGEVCLEREDGTLVSVYLGVNVLREGAVGLCLMVTDLTEQKRHQALIAAEALERSILEQAIDAIVVCDQSGNVIRASDAAAQLAGRNPLLQPFGSVFPIYSPTRGRSAAYSGKSGNRDALSLADVLRGETLRGVEATLKRADGQTLHLLLSAGPLRDELRQIVGCVVTLTDFTERKEIEEALHRSQERLGQITDSVPALISYLDANLCYQFINRGYEDWFGRPREWFLGKHVSEVLDEEVYRTVRGHLEGALAGRKATFEIVTRHQDGSRRHVRANYIPHLSDTGSTRGVYALVYDISESKHVEKVLRDNEEQLRRHADQLADADRRKDEFLATLAHELRNPLAPLQNALQIVRQPATDPQAAEPIWDMMERQVQIMARLVDDLLDVSRITRGRVDLRKERVNLRQVVERTLETVRSRLEERRHRCEVALPSEPVWLEADPARLEQVLANLLNNAAKYTAPGGLIRLTVTREGDEALVRVEDNGIGIRSEMLPRIFDLFAQADQIPGRVSDGLGIGLTLVRSLVEMHGGSVAAYSDGPGQGSTFVVRLPLSPEEASAAAEDDAPATRPPTATSPVRALRVLVVDDNVDGAESLALLLRLMGHDVSLTYDGNAAVAAAREGRLDLVLLDIGLPGLDGFEVARRLRADPAIGNPFLVAVTGYGQESDRIRSREAGFDDHLVKPVDLTILRDLIERLSRE